MRNLANDGNKTNANLENSCLKSFYFEVRMVVSILFLNIYFCNFFVNWVGTAKIKQCSLSILSAFSSLLCICPIQIQTTLEIGHYP